LHAERLQYRLTQNELAQRLHIGPKILAKLERREVLRIQSEDIEALKLYFGERLGIEKVWASPV
jgi:transcriptional regulator with XRE-family HTH domain